MRALLQAAPADRLAAVLPPATRETGGFIAVWAAILAEKVEPRLRMVVPAGSRESERMVRLVRAVRHGPLLRLAAPDAPLHDLLAAADVAVYLPAGEASLGAPLAALALGVPLITLSAAGLREAASLDDALWLAAERTPKAVAGALLSVLAQPADAAARACAAQRGLRGRCRAADRLSAYASLQAPTSAGMC
jgi:glycosyltransferase involved in cell wall biosynthesis